MIQAKRTSDSEILAAHKAVMHLVPPPSEPEVRNLDAVAEMFGSLFVEWRGRIYEVPPVSVPVGALLTRERLLLQKLPLPMTTEEAIAEEAAICGRVQALLPRAMRPAGWRRWFWPLTRRFREPFALMSPREVGEMLGFCCACQERSRLTVMAKHASGPL